MARGRGYHQKTYNEKPPISLEYLYLEQETSGRN